MKTTKLLQKLTEVQKSDLDIFYSALFPDNAAGSANRRNLLKNNKFEIAMTAIVFTAVFVGFLVKSILTAFGQSIPDWLPAAIYWSIEVPALSIVVLNLSRIFSRSFSTKYFFKQSLDVQYTKNFEFQKHVVILGLEKIVGIRSHFRREQEFLEKRFGLLIGAIDKLGLFPLLIVSAYSIADHVQKAGKFDTIDSIITGVVVSYLVSLPISNRLEKIRNVVSILDEIVANLTST